jgi:FkbM family methyltransferase
MARFVSFAQNGEDVVLWRAFGSITGGRYVDIGANDPSFYSVTRAFYDRGWSGLCVEPDAQLAERFRAERPRDVVLQSVIWDSAERTALIHHIEGTGLSTLDDQIAAEHLARGYPSIDITVPARTLEAALRDAGLAGAEVNFLVIDTEGSEAGVLRSVDFATFRPWAVVVEATRPLTTTPSYQEWEPVLLANGYRFCMFDGLSRFYADEARHPELVAQLSYPAGIFDDFVSSRTDDMVAAAERDFERRIEEREARIAQLQLELDALHRTVSWRVTAPLRAIRARRRRR